MSDRLTRVFTYRHRGIIILALGFIALNLIGLTRSSVVWVDEVVINDPAKELAFHGALRSSVFAGTDGFEQRYLWLPPGQPLITALVYKISGFGIWQTRIPVLLFGAAAVTAIYFVTLRLFGSIQGAMWAALLFALNPQFIHTARSGRMDPQCLFFSLLGILFFLRRREPATEGRTGCAALSGLAIGLAGLTHPIAVVWALTIGALILFQPGTDRVKSFLFFFACAALPVALWILYALQTPEIFKAQFFSILADHTTGGSPFSRLYEELLRYVRMYAYVPLLLVTFLLSLFWAILRRTSLRQEKSTTLVLFAVPFLFNTFVMIKEGGSEFYILHPVLILTALSGGMIATLRTRQEENNQREFLSGVVMAGLALLVGNLLLGGIGGRYAALAYQWDARDYTTVEQPILETIPQGSIVWGAPEVWYAAEKAGASLRVRGEPAAEKHDFAVTKTKAGIVTLPGFRFVRHIGKPLPPIFGRFTLSAADYQMDIWQAERVPHPAGRTDSTQQSTFR